MTRLDQPPQPRQPKPLKDTKFLVIDDKLRYHNDAVHKLGFDKVISAVRSLEAARQRVEELNATGNIPDIVILDNEFPDKEPGPEANENFILSTPNAEYFLRWFDKFLQREGIDPSWRETVVVLHTASPAAAELVEHFQKDHPYLICATAKGLYELEEDLRQGGVIE